ncbi:Rv3235 family protein [Yinghuangia seranimata]|uniref:Rv3235 family protein n=1 Tax=Yinghuangia seranimata TaxID=408067 RepID=UPI00248CAA0F|nr:Rv3235 family protein [Yinghuangia seranimata]MDI2131431.1 Rv3235 family protein [Yinghuangia seranimata]
MVHMKPHDNRPDQGSDETAPRTPRRPADGLGTRASAHTGEASAQAGGRPAACERPPGEAGAADPTEPGRGYTEAARTSPAGSGGSTPPGARATEPTPATPARRTPGRPGRGGIGPVGGAAGPVRGLPPRLGRGAAPMGALAVSMSPLYDVEPLRGPAGAHEVEYDEGGFPPLRLLRAPEWEPPTESVDAVVIPFPRRPAPVGPRPVLRLVGAPAPTADEPDVAEARRRVHHFAFLLAEVLSERRPFRQLGAHVTGEAVGRVEQLREALRAQDVTAVRVASWNAGSPADGVAEGFLRLRLGGERCQAVAVRLERVEPHSPGSRRPAWVCTALRFR